MRRLLYDTNVLLDVLLDRAPFADASAAALDVARVEGVTGYVSGHAVTTLAYILQRQIPASRVRAVLADLMAVLRVAPVNQAVVTRALGSSFADFEDAVCHAAAVEVEADCIVTRNVEDFVHATIPVHRPAALLASLTG